MRFGWSQHMQAASAIAASDVENQGTALALMGVAVLMLLQDLCLQDAPTLIALD
ncbi:MAG: hypothetical protein VKM98_01755 [Cyanobacteriota bacterium]|nr:hypothetical protein [Cyanobacteriota bacterium]